jgi:hypothetical protein
MLTCKHCLSDFERREGSGRKPGYCSDTCRVEANRRRVAVRNLRMRGPPDYSVCACVVCGKRFNKKNRLHLYCGRACRVEVQMRKKRRSARVARCQLCGKAYATQKAGSSRFCGRKCRRRVYLNRYKSERHGRYPECVCVCCGVRFYSRSSRGSLCCSTRCRYIVGAVRAKFGVKDSTDVMVMVASTATLVLQEAKRQERFK